jgi:hypothetical protein
MESTLALLPGCKVEHFDTGSASGAVGDPTANEKKSRASVTNNATQILKMRDIIFFLRANYIMGHFKGCFKGAKTFLRPPETSREMAHYVVCPNQKK